MVKVVLPFLLLIAAFASSAVVATLHNFTSRKQTGYHFVRFADIGCSRRWLPERRNVLTLIAVDEDSPEVLQSLQADHLLWTVQMYHLLPEQIFSLPLACD